RRGAAAALGVAMSELGLVREVSVRRAKLLLHLRVRAGARVGVVDHHGDRRAGRQTFVDAREDADLVGLLARRGDLALARAAAVELGLDVGLAQRQARRAAVDDDADAASVAFAPGADGEELAENVGHG